MPANATTRRNGPVSAGRLRRVLVFWPLLLLAVAAQGLEPEDIAVEVRRDGDAVTVDASFLAPVPVPVAWEVLTDFDRMARFVPNIQSSRTISAPGEPLVVAQKGYARYGIFSYSFETVRTVDLVPREAIHTRMISGNMRKFDALMRLSEEGGQTRLRYHADAVAESWLPPLLGPAFIRHETREQFAAVVAEMTRRHRGSRTSGGSRGDESY
jgi:carbon monoxide dehydrogenase subunit G